ncbi:MAG: STAS domain-containing protein [Deltaproteobacteria bacterium]|nr:STAS domain-containing protein [Deltaproteobacteria bacterium]
MMSGKWHILLPFLEWFRGYRTDHLKADIFSGLTVALVLIPQSMAYAQLAGLPSYYGLYASFLPPIMAALFGSSRQMATGPVAMVSLLTAVTLEPLATAGGQAYIAYAILLALMVGVFQFVLGVLKLGLLVNFLSHPVINGFTNAGAIIIASAQFSKLFGVHVDKAQHHYQTVLAVFKGAFHYTHWPTILMGILAFVLMYGLKRISPKIPSILIAVVITTIISWTVGFERDVKVSIDTIDYPEAKELITRFNTATKALTVLIRDRARANVAIELAKKSLDEIDRINATHQADIIAYRIKMLQDRAGVIRGQIRKMLLEGADSGNGRKFFTKGKLPPEAHGDGRIWRIRVGLQPLGTDAVTLKSGGDVVGTIPGGLPALTIPKFDADVALKLLPATVIIALLGFMEAISVARAMAAKTGQRIDPNQELIGQGLANICGAIGKSYPGAGSFSRSAVNLQAGAVSGLSNVFASLAVVATLLFFTPLLYHLPQAVLAAIIMMAVTGLINIRGFVHIWKAQWYDGVICVITFVCTLGFAPHLDKGIFIGVVLSLMVFLYKSMHPKVVDLSLGLDMALHDSVSFGLKECRYIDVVRFDGPLFFANASYLEDQIRHRRRTKKHLKHIIIAAGGINDIDASGEEALSLTVDRVRSAGIDISFSGVNESVMTVIERTHLLAKIGEDHIYPSMKKAINAVYEYTHKGGSEENCPLTTVCAIHGSTGEKGDQQCLL